MKIPLATLMLLAATMTAPTVVAVNSGHPDSPDFDPIARMKRFDSNWEPPKISAKEVAKHPLGSKGNPVRSHGPTGQKKYLNRLICPSGEKPVHERLGSHGDGIYGYHVDEYELSCGERKTRIFMDLYHPKYVETSAVPGFTFRPVVGSN